MTTASFIDTMQPATPAELEGWATFLAMPASCMKATREAFLLVHAGDTPGNAFKVFVARTKSVLDDEALLLRMEKALEGLALPPKAGSSNEERLEIGSLR
jgi:hypothetical protein